MNTQLLNRPVGQLVVEQPSRSRVFERWGIDYCCGGKRVLSDACVAKKVDPDAILRDLEASDSRAEPPEVNWAVEPLARLCDHIVLTHHQYLWENLPRLSALTEKVADRHGAKDPRLVELHILFESFRVEMEGHMDKEERLLFPAICSLRDGPSIDGLQGTIHAMLEDHDSAGEDLARMRLLTDGFTPSPTACNTHRAMLHALSELEADLHQHVHKENNILFPRIQADASPA